MIPHATQTEKEGLSTPNADGIFFRTLFYISAHQYGDSVFFEQTGFLTLHGGDVCLDIT